jgi:hypothetical protein
MLITVGDTTFHGDHMMGSGGGGGGWGGGGGGGGGGGPHGL